MRLTSKKAAALGLLLFMHAAASAASPIFDLEAFFRSASAQLLFDASPEGLARRNVLRDWIESSADPVNAEEVETRLGHIRAELGRTTPDSKLLDHLTAEQFSARMPESYAASRERFAKPSEPVARAKELVSRWSSRAAWVEDVGFSMDHDVAPAHARKNVLVISRAGLSAAEQTALLRDSLQALGTDTVSFPVREGATHLFVRTGAESLDFGTRSLSRKLYSLPSSARLEPVVALSREEAARLAQYTAAALANPDAVLGSYGFDGVGTARTQGALDANRGIGPESHNCVSWIATAPIGEGGRPLLELVGARPEWVVHTNPGWWNNYLVAGAPFARVPLVIFWTDEPLVDALQKVRPGADFPQWDFNRQ